MSGKLVESKSIICVVEADGYEIVEDKNALHITERYLKFESL